jgi:NH3-dependent NAD+ synthetase
MTYEEIDNILQELEKKTIENPDGRIMTAERFQSTRDSKKPSNKNVKRLLDLIKRNKHKHEMPPICKLTRE